MEPEWLKATGAMAERIRAFDWGATPIGPIETWPPSLTTALALVLESPLPMVLIWGRELVTLPNDAYEAMVNAPHEALGGSFLEIWGPIRDVVAPQIADAFAGKSVRMERQGFDLHDTRGGFERRFFDYTFSPVRDEGGEVVGILHAGFEITARERAYKALQTSEARLKAAVDSVPVGMAILDTSGEFVLSNERYRRYLPTGKMPSRDADRIHRWQSWDAEGRLVDPEQYPGARALRGEMVTEGMEFLYTGEDGGQVWTSVATAPIRDRTGKVTGAASIITDITERKQIAEALARSEKRSAFLLKLSDTLRPMRDATAIRQAACTILGEHLNADWIYFVDFSVEAGYGVVAQDYVAPGLHSLAGRYSAEAFRTTNDLLATGRTWIVGDVREEQRIAQHEREYCAERRVISWINVPLIKDGALEAILCIVQTRPRAWSDVEIEIAEEAAERLWASVRRARAENALRESEIRLKTLIAGVPQLIWRAEAGGQWIWASPQWEEQTGLRVEDSLGSGWLAALHPDDQESVAQCWDEAIRTGRLDIEARICTIASSDCRWFQIRATPVRNEAGEIVEWLGTSTDIHDLRELQARQSVLVAELQHRTRNLITVVRAIARRIRSKSHSLEDFDKRFGDRLEALSRVQGLLSNLSAGQRVNFDELLRSELSSIAVPEDRVVLEGPAGIQLRSATVQTMALVLHELTTNATKHGALSGASGRLTIRWDVVGTAHERQLHVDWREEGVAMDEHATRGKSRGYGLELIERALPYQLDARTTSHFGSDGIRCTIDVPLPAA